jgi:hypothetical protein
MICNPYFGLLDRVYWPLLSFWNKMIIRSERPLRNRSGFVDRGFFNELGIDDYTADGTLKLGLFLTLLVLVPSRFLLYGPLSLLASRGGITGGNSYLDVSVLNVDSPFLMLASIPPVLILFILVARNKNSPDLARKTWANGKVIMVASLICQLALQLMEVWGVGKVAFPQLMGLIVSGYILFYFARMPRARDVFASFPAKGA